MPITEAQKKAMYRYRDKNLKRVPLDMQNSEYAALKAVADAVGKPVNRYIKDAIAAAIERDGAEPMSGADHEKPVQSP